MAEKRVTQSGKAWDGDITSLCGSWGSVTKATAISEIERRTNAYYVQDANSRRADVVVRNSQDLWIGFIR